MGNIACFPLSFSSLLLSIGISTRLRDTIQGHRQPPEGSRPHSASHICLARPLPLHVMPAPVRHPMVSPICAIYLRGGVRIAITAHALCGRLQLPSIATSLLNGSSHRTSDASTTRFSSHSTHVSAVVQSHLPDDQCRLLSPA